MNKLWQIEFEGSPPTNCMRLAWVSADTVEQAEELASNSGGKLAMSECFAWSGEAGHAYLVWVGKGA